MKITLQIGKRTLEAKLPYEGAPHVAVEGHSCPKCRPAVTPLLLRGVYRHYDHDTYYSDAHCVACGTHVGELRAKVETIFGIEEDTRVLHGRCRVY